MRDGTRDTGINGIESSHICQNITPFGFELSSHCNSSGIASTSSQSCYFFSKGIHTLKTSDNDNSTAIQFFLDAKGFYIDDSCVIMTAVGKNSALRTGETDSFALDRI